MLFILTPFGRVCFITWVPNKLLIGIGDKRKIFGERVERDGSKGI